MGIRRRGELGRTAPLRCQGMVEVHDRSRDGKTMRQDDTCNFGSVLGAVWPDKRGAARQSKDREQDETSHPEHPPMLRLAL